MRPPRLSTTPPKLPALVGRASPAGSKNFGGIGKAADAPNKSATAASSPFGAASGDPMAMKRPPRSSAPMGTGLPTQDFCKGGKVISTKTF
jgi:hypothetical protein